MAKQSMVSFFTLYINEGDPISFPIDVSLAQLGENRAPLRLPCISLVYTVIITDLSFASCSVKTQAKREH